MAARMDSRALLGETKGRALSKLQDGGSLARTKSKLQSLYSDMQPSIRAAGADPTVSRTGS